MVCFASDGSEASASISNRGHVEIEDGRLSPNVFPFFPTSLCGVLVFGCALPPLRSRLPSPARRLSSPHNSVDIVESEAGIQGLDHACTQHTTRCGDASVPNAQGRVQETDYIVSGRGRWFSACEANASQG